MIHPWHDLPAGTNPPEDINVVVEIPQGSRNKYEIDKTSGMFKLDRVLYSAVHYPGDYGLMPRTLSDDGDPLDVLVLVKESTFAGCVMACRPLGLLRMRDNGELDEKIIAVAARDPLRAGLFDIADLPSHMLREIEHFFQVYKDLEEKKTETRGYGNRVEAEQVIDEARRRFAPS